MSAADDEPDDGLLSLKDGWFIVGVMVVGMGVQVALGELILRPIILAIIGLLLLACIAGVRSRRRR